MGNKVETEFRGEIDVVLTDIIKKLEEEEDQTFLLYAEDKGVLDHEDYTDRLKLIADLTAKDSEG